MLATRAPTNSTSGAAGKALSKKPSAPPPARWTPSWMWLQLKETALHYWHGSKLLYADTRIAAKLLKRIFVGRTLSRREHKLLVRVCADIARLVPLMFFVLVPMMEFALPFAIRLFPNLLPSTFEERHHAQEKQKKLLKVRMEMAQLLQHTLDERAAQVTLEARSKQREAAERQAQEEGMGHNSQLSLVEKRVKELRSIVKPQGDGRLNADVREFMVRMKEGGRAASADELLSVMRGFKDNVTLDHLYRDQLVAMAQFLNMNHFAPTALLRFQLRQRLKRLRNEDKEILWEGVTGLNDAELKADLRNRGLPTASLSREDMMDALQRWLALSQVKEIPYSLLILTNMLHFAHTRHEQKAEQKARAATEEEELPLAAAQAAMSSLPTEMAVKSTLVDDVSDDEKLEALKREEALVEEERFVLDSAVDKLEDKLFADDEPEQAPVMAPSHAVDAADTEADADVELTREQIADLAEAIDTMIDSPLRHEKEEMAELEAERVAAHDRVAEAKSASKQVAMLDSRVQLMLERLKSEMAESESSIGEAFHKLDLDGDGMLSHRELLDAIGELHVSNRPDAKAFEELLIKMDVDADGQISVGDVRKLMKAMREMADDDDDDDVATEKQPKKAASAT